MASKEQQIRNFLAKFRGTHSSTATGGKILCHSTENSKATGMRNYATIRDCLDANANGKDVYFYVNNGGTKKAQINEYVACFTDIDAGRDTNGKYLTPSKVATKKVAMLKKVKEFPITPNVVVETRNGFHLYWFIQPITGYQGSANAVQWAAAQARISSFFADVGSDVYVGKPNQIMRVPYTKWIKTWAGKKEQFNVTVRTYSNTKYYLKDILDATKNVRVLHKSQYNLPIADSSYTGPAWWREGVQSVRPVITTIQIAKKVPMKSSIPPAPVWQNKPTQPTASSGDSKVQLAIELRDFLEEVGPQLFYKGMKNSSKVSKSLVYRIQQEFGI